jgi:hypothetical protein
MYGFQWVKVSKNGPVSFTMGSMWVSFKSKPGKELKQSLLLLRKKGFFMVGAVEAQSGVIKGGPWHKFIKVL